MQQREIQISGAVVYWSAGPTRRETLRSYLEQVSMEELTPNVRTDAAALKSALLEYCANEKTRKFDLGVEPRQNQARNGFEVMRKKRGAERNEYEVAFAARIESWGGLIVEGDANREAIQAAFDRHKAQLTGAAIGKLLVDVLARLGGTTLRESGGVYWLPEEALPAFERVAAFVEECGEEQGNKVYLLRTAMDEATVRAVRDAITTEVTKESEAIVQEVMENDFGDEALARRQLLAAALHARVSQYERILGEAMSTLHEVVRVAEQAAAAAESVRESNEVFDNLFDA